MFGKMGIVKTKKEIQGIFKDHGTVCMSLENSFKLPFSAIFMAENPPSEVRTRLIDTRYHYIRKHVEDGFIKIIF
jgi:hypothetical protein